MKGRDREYSKVVYKVLTFITDSSLIGIGAAGFPLLTLIWKKHQQLHYQQERDPLISRCSLSQSRFPSTKLTMAIHFICCKNVFSITFGTKTDDLY